MQAHHAVQGLCAVAALTLCACAAAPALPPHPLETAANAIADAEAARAADYAPAEMRTAREKLEAARALLRLATPGLADPNAAKERWLAEEASADAALAEARAQDIRTQSAVRELQAAPVAPPPADAPAPNGG